MLKKLETSNAELSKLDKFRLIELIFLLLKIIKQQRREIKTCRKIIAKMKERLK